MSDTLRHSHSGFGFFRSSSMALPPSLSQRDIDRLARHTGHRGRAPSVRRLAQRLAAFWRQPRSRGDS